MKRAFVFEFSRNQDEKAEREVLAKKNKTNNMSALALRQL